MRKIYNLSEDFMLQTLTPLYYFSQKNLNKLKIDSENMCRTFTYFFSMQGMSFLKGIVYEIFFSYLNLILLHLFLTPGKWNSTGFQCTG